jgi:protein-disulfide isomerase
MFSKKNSNFLQIGVIILSVYVLGLSAYIYSAPNNPADPDAIRTIIVNNPKMIVEALEAHYKAEVENKKKNRGSNLSQLSNDLFSNKTPNVGKTKYKVNVVEVYDFNCGYCKKAFNDINKLISEKVKANFYFLDYPVLSKNSELLSRFSVAAHKLDPSKYFKVHASLMMNARGKSKEQLLDLMQSHGYNRNAFSRKLESKEVTKQLQWNREAGQKLSINGTPAFIINDEIIDGYMGYDRLKQKIKEAQ